MFWRIFTSSLFLFFPILQAKSPEQIDKNIHCHFLIADYRSAYNEAYEGLIDYPESKILWIDYLQSLAYMGEEKAMMTNWIRFVEKYPAESHNKEILESLAWAVINKGANSSSPNIRVCSMLGAFFSQDAKGVKILQQGLLDDNSFLRTVAVKLSSHLRDNFLQDQLLKMLKTEKVWKVRLAVIEAISEGKVIEAKNELKKLIEHHLCHAEEKTLAIKSIVSLSDQIDSTQLFQLVASDRAEMRILACELVAHFDQTKDVDKLLPLITDSNADVRAKVFQTIGHLRVATIGEMSVVDLSEKAVNDSDPIVATTAAWILTINAPEKGLPIFEKLLKYPIPEIRYLVSSALAATGKYGLSLIKKAFKENTDIYVKMNLAFGLIGQRVEIKAACDCLFLGLSQKECWSWDEDKNFKVLIPNKVKHDEAIPNYPQAVNQLTRLEILQILAVLHDPNAQLAIKNFLKESQWGISGMASALLLTEGEDDAVELVYALLKDPDPKVKVQAALILSLWSRGNEVIQLLHEAYPHADRELKEQILEGIGRIGSESSLTFLAERLQEPYQTLRLIAAAALLECLYH